MRTDNKTDAGTAANRGVVLGARLITRAIAAAQSAVGWMSGLWTFAMHVLHGLAATRI